jgi:hypothetical protein
MCCRQMCVGILATVVLGCVVAAARAEEINYPTFSSVAGLNLQGSAVRSGDVLRVTTANYSLAGSAWFDNQQAIRNGFLTTFQFRVTQLGGIKDDDGNTGADGLAFVIQNQSRTALGSAAASMGYEGIANSVAIEFDTFRNSIMGDPNGNHISVQTRGTTANSAWHSQSLGCATDLPDMSDGNVHTASILYRPGTITISLDNAQVLSVPLNLSTKLSLADGKAWVGFTSATWAAFENHDVLNWSMTSVPEPSTPALLGAGAVGLAICAWRRHSRRLRSRCSPSENFA